MRITSGEFRGRPIKTPNSDKTHPMGDRERLALFNRLNSHLGGRHPDSDSKLKGAKVLDLYAGSGALGFEALSRGAGSVVFVEQEKMAIAAISFNCSTFSIENQVKIIPTHVKKYLKTAPDTPFDIIFCDPPYDNFHPEDFANVANFLSPSGFFVLSYPEQKVGQKPERDPEQKAPKITGLTLLSSKSYARAHISIYSV